MNEYDVEQVCIAHPRRTKTELEQAYALAWTTYFTPMTWR